MATLNPVAKLDPRFSSSDAKAKGWAEAERMLDEAEIFWLSTVRPDGRPHVTPLIAVWVEGAMYFCTDDPKQKLKLKLLSSQGYETGVVFLRYARAQEGQ